MFDVGVGPHSASRASHEERFSPSTIREIVCSVRCLAQIYFQFINVISRGTEERQQRLSIYMSIKISSFRVCVYRDSSVVWMAFGGARRGQKSETIRYETDITVKMGMNTEKKLLHTFRRDNIRKYMKMAMSLSSSIFLAALVSSGSGWEKGTIRSLNETQREWKCCVRVWRMLFMPSSNR